MVQLAEVAAWLGCTIAPQHAQVLIRCVMPLEDADTDALSFLAFKEIPHHRALQREKLRNFATTRAAAVLVPGDWSPDPDQQPQGVLLAVKDVETSLHQCLQHLHPQPTYLPGIHPRAWVDTTAQIGKGVHIGAGTVLEAGVKIGMHSVISAGCVIAQNTCIGAHCILHPNVVVYHDCWLGDQVILHAGCVIGSAGFSYKKGTDGGYLSRPHIGRVVIENAVEIGANSCIDRATFGETRIAAGCKIDNLVHIAHNVRIEESVLLCAQVGIAGSARIGKGACFGGKAGAIDHVTIPSGTMVRAGDIYLRHTSNGNMIIAQGIRRMQKKSYKKNPC